MKEFKELSMNEMLEIDGGVFGIDDAIFWTLVGIGFGAGVGCAISRKSRR